MNRNELLQLSEEDLNRYFGNTFVKATFPGENFPVWAYLESIQDHHNLLFKCLKNQSYKCSLRNSILDLSFPESGLYNHNSTVCMLSKKPARRWL